VLLGWCPSEPPLEEIADTLQTGPTSSVASTYVTAAIQSAANLLGHVPGSTKKCAKRGAIKCVVKFGAGEIDYNSYT
jgi:hypothetical protein